MDTISPHLYQIDDDDLFARPPRSARRQVPQPTDRTARITCRVCSALETVPLDHPALLCRECLADVPATRARVRAWLDGVLAQEHAAWEAWEAVREPNQRFWERIQDAGHTPETDQRARAAHPTYAALLDAEAEYNRTLAALGQERERLEKAIGEIDQL